MVHSQDTHTSKQPSFFRQSAFYAAGFIAVLPITFILSHTLAWLGIFASQPRVAVASSYGPFEEALSLQMVIVGLALSCVVAGIGWVRTDRSRYGLPLLGLSTGLVGYLVAGALATMFASALGLDDALAVIVMHIGACIGAGPACAAGMLWRLPLPPRSIREGLMWGCVALIFGVALLINPDSSFPEEGSRTSQFAWIRTEGGEAFVAAQKAMLQAPSLRRFSGADAQVTFPRDAALTIIKGDAGAANITGTLGLEGRRGRFMCDLDVTHDHEGDTYGDVVCRSTLVTIGVLLPSYQVKPLDSHFAADLQTIEVFRGISAELALGRERAQRQAKLQELIGAIGSQDVDMQRLEQGGLLDYRDVLRISEDRLVLPIIIRGTRGVARCDVSIGWALPSDAIWPPRMSDSTLEADYLDCDLDTGRSVSFWGEDIVLSDRFAPTITAEELPKEWPLTRAKSALGDAAGELFGPEETWDVRLLQRDTDLELDPANARDDELMLLSSIDHGMYRGVTPAQRTYHFWLVVHGQDAAGLCDVSVPAVQESTRKEFVEAHGAEALSNIECWTRDAHYVFSHSGELDRTDEEFPVLRGALSL